MDVTYRWRGDFDNTEVNSLHAEGFGHPIIQDDWRHQVERHSLGWVCARERDDLVGFVNVLWDGSTHAFIVDTLVSPRVRRRGIGTHMVAVAADEGRAAGCRWLHVDFEDELAAFCLDTCGFVRTSAGLIELQPPTVP
jgi:ribosomal protein S18 acetylase RimI-like enzyme